MNLCLELISKEIAETVYTALKTYDFLNISQDIELTAVTILTQIRDVIADDNLSDFDAIEEIINILDRNNLYTGTRHDFG